MKIEAAKAITEQSSDLRLRESYSGRFMFGKETAAVVGDPVEFSVARADAIVEATQDGNVDLMDCLKEKFKEDDMGLQKVYY